jgi:predicted RNase H-like HicB family nuclease
MKQNYIAVIEDGGTSYGVTFPDFDGCVTAADTIEEAVSLAHEALNLHIAGMAEDGEKIPVPTNVKDIKVDPDIKVTCLFVIEATLPGKTKRINISLDESLLEEIAAASSNRSAFLAKAARHELDRAG